MCVCVCVFLFGEEGKEVVFAFCVLRCGGKGDKHGQILYVHVAKCLLKGTWSIHEYTCMQLAITLKALDSHFMSILEGTWQLLHKYSYRHL